MQPAIASAAHVLSVPVVRAVLLLPAGLHPEDFVEQLYRMHTCAFQQSVTAGSAHCWAGAGGGGPGGRSLLCVEAQVQVGSAGPHEEEGPSWYAMLCWDHLHGLFPLEVSA